MSSGFVSGGTVDAPIERSDEWLAAQKEIEANRQRKAELARQPDGKSLYETLEANKAAKQDAFEEANRLKNQFRALDEDEVEFLDSVLESTRREEERVKKETAEGLALFRQQQEEADKRARAGNDEITAEAGSPTGEGESWGAGPKKRKRTKDKEVIKGLKVRRTSTAAEGTKVAQMSPPAGDTTKSSNSTTPAQADAEAKSKSPTISKKSPAPAVSKGGLVSYGSDDDDDW